MGRIYFMFFHFLLFYIIAPALVFAGGWLSPVKISDNIYSDEVASINYDGTKITYYSDEDGDSDIYIIELSEGSWTPPLKLTYNDTPDTMPVINRDGTKISFIGGTDDNRDVFFVEYTGGAWQEAVQLTDSLDGDFFPSISANGEKITYQLKDSSENRYIWFIERMGGAWQTPIELPTVTDNNMFPMISKDGSKIAFFGVNDGCRDIYFLEQSGGNWQGPLNLTDNNEHDCQPSINDDGTKIVYYWTGELFLPHVIPGATSDIRLLEYKNGAWQPPVSIASGSYYEFDPTIDEVGNRITYAEAVPGVGEHTYLVEFSEGSWQTPVNLTNGITSGFRPNISGDGNTIVYYGLGLVEGVMDADNEIYILSYADFLGSITGQVTDLGNPANPIEDVLVRATPGGFVTKTDADGYYTLDVFPGVHTVTAVKDCLVPESVTDINVSDGENVSVNINLTLGGNCAPDAPGTPLPESGSIDQPLDLTVMWEGSDPDPGNSMTYDVYLGVQTLHHIEMHIVSGDQTEKTCTLPGLEPEQKYFWKIAARDSQGYETVSPVWSFTTGVLPDIDGDGVADTDDNCPEIANGPNLGTCIAGNAGEPCSSKDDCGIDGFCSMNQEDSDSDGIGDACDPYTMPCLVEVIYGNSSEKTESLRNFRDYLLSQTPEGQEIIKLYYDLSPVIVKAMEEEEFKEEVRELIEGVLGLFGETVD